MPVPEDVPAAELASLRAQFEHAESVCRAIRSGEVDALVMGEADEDPQVVLLSHSYARYRHLVEQMQQGAVTTSSQGDILFGNRALADMLGAESPDALYGSSLEAHVQPADRERLAPLLRGSAPAPVDLRLLRADGAALAARVARVHQSEEFATLLLTDRSLQEEIEEARATLAAIRRGEVDAFVIGGEQIHLLSSAHAPYRALVEKMRQGAVTVTQTNEIAFVNARFAAMVDSTAESLIGRSLWQVIGERSRRPLEALAAAGSGQTELTLRPRTGVQVPVQASLTQLDQYRLILFTDLTRQKRHEAADHSTRTFLAILAHELAPMIASIRRSAATLREASLDPEQRRALDDIDRQAERMGGLVGELERVNPTD